MSLVAWSGRLFLQKKNHHPRSTVTCPRFSRFFFQKIITKNTLSHTHTHVCTRTLICTCTHTVVTHMHTYTHTPSLTPTHPLTHTHIHTHPQEAQRLLDLAVSPQLAFQGSAKEMVRLPKDWSSRILPPFSASGVMYSEDQSQEREKEVLPLQGLSSGEPRDGLLALQGWQRALPPPSPSSLSSTSWIL